MPFRWPSGLDSWDYDIERFTQGIPWQPILHKPLSQKVKDTIADYTKRMALGLSWHRHDEYSPVIKDEQVC